MPTRKTNTVDLTFSNATHMLHSPVHSQISDHHLVQFLTDYNSDLVKHQPRIYDRLKIIFIFERANTQKMKKALQGAIALMSSK